MWADSGAGDLSLNSLFVNFISFILFIVVLSLVAIQFLRQRKNKPMSKRIAGFGITLSMMIFIINMLMTFGHIDFVQEQIKIVNDPNYFKTSSIGGQSIREGWIEDGYRIIVWNIVVSIILGLLPLWLFYHQYKNINKFRTSTSH